MWIRSGWKRSEHFADQRDVAQKRGIEAQVFFEREGEKAARQLERPHVAVFDECLSAVAGAHAKKGKIAPAREGLKVAAGVGDPVHFVERVGKVGDTRRRECESSDSASGDVSGSTRAWQRRVTANSR